jgi:hypothetical protein
MGLRNGLWGSVASAEASAEVLQAVWYLALSVPVATLVTRSGVGFGRLPWAPSLGYPFSFLSSSASPSQGGNVCLVQLHEDDFVLTHPVPAGQGIRAARLEPLEVRAFNRMISSTVALDTQQVAAAFGMLHSQVDEIACCSHLGHDFKALLNQPVANKNFEVRIGFAASRFSVGVEIKLATRRTIQCGLRGRKQPWPPVRQPLLPEPEALAHERPSGSCAEAAPLTHHIRIQPPSLLLTHLLNDPGRFVLDATGRPHGSRELRPRGGR